MSPTSRVAIDGRLLAAYFHKYETRRVGGHPARTRRYIHDVLVDQDTDGRILRRWDSGTTVTLKAAERLLTKFNLTIEGYELWCYTRNLQPTIRGKIG